MYKTIFISILLTFCTIAGAQTGPSPTPVRLVFTTHFQQHPFGYDPVWRSWPDGSLSRALSYIEAHRRAMGEYHFALVACGQELPVTYTIHPGISAERILEYGRYETASYFTRGGMDFAIVEPERYFDYDPDVRIGLFPEPQTDKQRIAETRGIDIAVMASGWEPEVFRLVNIHGDTVTVINTGTTGK